MEKLCLDQLRLEQQRDNVCSAVGNSSRALVLKKKGCLKEKCCSVLRLRDALKRQWVSVFRYSWRRNEEANSFALL